MIVDDNLNHRNLISGKSRNLIHVHTEAAVARDIDYGFLRPSHLRAHSSSEAKAHGAQSSGSQKFPRFFVDIILRRPHLMLADIRGNHRIPLGHTVKFLHNRRTGQAVFMFHRITFLQSADLLKPFRIFLRLQTFIQTLQSLFQIPDHACVHNDVFVDLRRVNIKLQDLCILCKPAGISCHPVREAGAKNDQQITFCHAQIGSFRSMHTQHSRIQRIIPREHAFSHQAVADRSLKLMRQLPHFLRRSGNHSAAADKNIRAFCFADQCSRLLKGLLCNRIHLALDFFRFFVFIFIFRRGNILCDIHEHRTGASAFGDFKRTAQSFRQIFNILYNHAVLRDGHHNACDIHLLKAVSAQQ